VYDWQQIKKKIIEHSEMIGIDKIGFTSGEPFLEIEDILREHQEKGFSSGFEESNIDLRINPALSMSGVCSIISVAVAYPSLELRELCDQQEYRGKFCCASWGQDYHKVLEEKLSKLDQFIKILVSRAETLIMVDKGPLSDRAVALRAGLGWIGKNGSLITEEFGSFVYLGEILTNLPLESDEQKVINLCGGCNECLNACPMQAILKDNSTINCQKCLAFNTLTKGHLEDDLKGKIAEQKYLYGCDICQLVCPFNKDKNNDWHREFRPEYELVNPVLEKVIKLSNRKFKDTFGHMSGSWRGKKNLQRNAILILGRTKGAENIQLLADLLEHDLRPEIRAAAAWSLGQYDLAVTQNILKAHLPKEKDVRVAQDIKRAIKN